MTLDQYREKVDELPDFEQPEVFGMHDNANITFQLQESKLGLDTILSIQPRDSGTGGGAEKSTDDIVKEMAVYFIDKLPFILNT